jgi:hypothetical protein
MSDANWRDSCREAGDLLDLLNQLDASRRKFRLLCAAWCRRVEDLLPNQEFRDRILLVERFAEGRLTDDEREQAWEASDRSLQELPGWADFINHGAPNPSYHAALAVDFALWSDARQNHGNAEGAGYVLIDVVEALSGMAFGMNVVEALEGMALGGAAPTTDRWNEFQAAERAKLAEVIREVFGNPFRPVLLEPAWVRWKQGTVRKLAQMIYEARVFHHLPVLADALEEAGCTQGDILAHCRRPGDHVLGCWVLDRLLDRP